MKNEQQIYVVYDAIAQSTVVVASAPNAGTFIRSNARMLRSFNANFVNDFDIYEVGTVVTDTEQREPVTIVSKEPISVPWDAYKFPETQVEQVSS